MSNISIIKRNNSVSPWDIQKIKKTASWATEDIEGVDSLELERSLHLSIRNGMTSIEVINEMINVCLSKITMDEPNWSKVAGRLALMNLNKEVRHNVAVMKEKDVKRKFGYGSFSKYLAWAESVGVYKNISCNYSDDELAIVDSLINHDRDLDFEYSTVVSMQKSYLQRKSGKLVELPQEMYMAIALTLAPHVSVNAREKMQNVKDFYEEMSSFRLSPATPVVHNIRTIGGSGMSCAVVSFGDSLDQIDHIIAQIKKEASKGTGWGAYVGKLRAHGSWVKDMPNTAGGTIPLISQINSAIVSVDQLGQRDSNIAVYQDIWHADLPEFLELKTENGDIHTKAYDIFLGVCVNDEFFRRREAGENWTLIDPYEARKILGVDLADYFGDEWVEKYKTLENSNLNIRKNIKANDLWKLLIKTISETGDPYFFNRDVVASKNNNPNYPIYSSNLCTEILSPFTEDSESTKVTTEDGTVEIITRKLGYVTTCNLVSYNLGVVDLNNHHSIEKTARTAIKLIDAVISENNVASSSAKRFNNDFRSAGIGYIGYHHFLAKNHLNYGHSNALKLTNTLLEEIAFNVIDESMKLAINFGAYPKFPESNFAKGIFFGRDAYQMGEKWAGLADNVKSFGVRNGYMFAIAPNTSTSLLTGETPSIYPVPDKVSLKDGYSGAYLVPAPELDKLNMWYKPAHAVSYIEYFDTIATFQNWVDQGISAQTYFDPNTQDAFDLHTMYMYALVEKRLKTTYYIRQKPVTCFGCAN